MRRLIAAALACLLLAPLALALAEPALAPLPPAETLTVKAGRTDRDFIVYQPASTGPHPVVLVFHGGGGGAEWMAGRSQLLTRTLTGAGYITVYMNGSTKRGKDNLRTWNAGSCCAYAQRARINEAAYVDAVIDDLGERLKIDRTRIYLVGHSNGAMLSYRLAGAMKTTPRAIAAVSGAIFSDQPDVPDRTSVFMFHGVDDSVLSYEAHPDAKAERFRIAPHLGFVEAEARIAVLKACGEQDAEPAPGGVSMTRRDCPGDSALVAVTSLSGGHDWPSGPNEYAIEAAMLNFFETRR